MKPCRDHLTVSRHVHTLGLFGGRRKGFRHGITDGACGGGLATISDGALSAFPSIVQDIRLHADHLSAATTKTPFFCKRVCILVCVTSVT